MYAVLRRNTFDPDRLAASTAALEEFDRLHAGQPGFAGAVVVDLDQGRRFALNLWDSPERARAAVEVLSPVVGRLLVPLMTAPSELIGAGPVLSWQLPRSG